MVSDDFSFPITEPIPCFLGSPPLWKFSYEVFSASPSSGYTGESSDEEHQRRRSFPMAERDKKLEDEERMDMLWENFNDELMPSLDKNKEQWRFRKGDKLDSGLAGDKAEVYCVKAWKMSKPRSSTAIFSSKKPSMLTMMKVMKKLFLLHNSHCQKKSI